LLRSIALYAQLRKVRTRTGPLAAKGTVMKITIPVTCIARGTQSHWEAICLDFNIAAQGRSLDEVSRLLEEAVTSYMLDALKEAPQDRDRLLRRRAPFSVRLYWTLGLVWATLRGNRLKDGNDEGVVTVPFAVACPA
jgi:hypothetical protein